MDNNMDHDISQMFETQQAINSAIEHQKNNWRQTITMLLTVIAMAVGSVLWVSNTIAETKEWVIKKDFVTKVELYDIIKEQYVKKEDFATVKEKLENLNEKHTTLIQTLEKMDKKLDRLDDAEPKYQRRDR